MTMYQDLALTKAAHVAVIEIQRPPMNYFDVSLINQIADALSEVDSDLELRATVLAAQGKAFCAGANFGGAPDDGGPGSIRDLYTGAVRIFRNKKPIIAAVHGAAVGGGLGLAMAADFRVTCPEARFVANFTRLGFHPGFGLTVTLAEAIGRNSAELLLYTSRRISGEEALKIGLANILVPQTEVRAAALALASEIAESSPLGVMATRASMRAGLAGRVMDATERELAEQTRLMKTNDFQEGLKAMAERRVPRFEGC
jgi:enoyl-CoA hydratase/carnithine racemase